MPKAQSTNKPSKKKSVPSKEKVADMDLKEPCQVLLTASTARPEQASVTPSVAELAKAEHTPGISKLTPEQRDYISAELAKADGLPMRAIARNIGATFEAVKHLADKTGARPDRKLRAYGRRLGKRLPIPERVDIYAEIARASLSDVTGGEKLRALERIDALDGIVTRREQGEIDSNGVHVGPLFVLPAQAAPVVDAVTVDVRPSQDKS